MRTPEENARALCEVMMREDDLLRRFGRYLVFLTVLEGAEMKEITCPKCRGSGRVSPDAGTFYRDTRPCYIPAGCNETGKIRKLQMPQEIKRQQ